VVFKYFRILVTFIQSEVVGCSEFLAAFPTAYEISGRVHLSKYIKESYCIFISSYIEWFIIFSSFILSPTHGVLVFLVYLILNDSNNFSINPL